FKKSNRTFFVFPFVILLIFGQQALAREYLSRHQQVQVVVSGYVRDTGSGEALSASTVTLQGLRTYQGVTNDYGFYSISVPPGSYRVIVSRVGYDLYESAQGPGGSADFVLNADTTYHVALRSTGQLEEVIIDTRRQNNQLNNPMMGLSRIDVTEIQQIPVLLGERDVLKTIQLLPGVMSGGEGSSQFFVRGGMGDQNLILLDGATVFNASH